MFLKNAQNSRVIKVGSIVSYCGDKCKVINIYSENFVQLKKLSDGVIWDYVSSRMINCIAVDEMDVRAKTHDKSKRGTKSHKIRQNAP
jgi:hypothetical protein